LLVRLCRQQKSNNAIKSKILQALEDNPACDNDALRVSAAQHKIAATVSAIKMTTTKRVGNDRIESAYQYQKRGERCLNDDRARRCAVARVKRNSGWNE